MSANPVPRVLAGLRREAVRADAGDADLLARFVADRDDGTFAALVGRHAPMVLGVCRRVLGNAADAEDACQAVFLTLVRKAGSVRPPGMVGGWLHGVARHTALRARRAIARRIRREYLVGQRPRPAVPDPDLRAAIDHELDRLPARYRAAVVLCDLEGRTRSEAAARLGWAEGTVASRLARGRRLLASRLGRIGIGAAVVLPIPAAGAEPEVLTAIVRAGVGRAAPSPAAVALSHGVLRAMTLNRLVVASAVVLGFAVVGLTVRQAMPPATAHTPVVVLPKVEPASPVKDPEPAVSVATAPPVVVKTVPAAGAADVDPAVGEVRVTFSKDMTDKSWSWSQLSDDTFPKPVGDKPIAYDKDRRTCVMKVKLEAGKTYAIWLNSEKFTNFKDADGRPAVPYLLVFQTKRAAD